MWLAEVLIRADHTDELQEAAAVHGFAYVNNGASGLFFRLSEEKELLALGIGALTNALREPSALLRVTLESESSE